MSEYYIELQDAQGTYYGATGITDEVVYFEDLDDARMFAKGRLYNQEQFTLARVIDTQTHRVVDFFGV